LTCSTLVRFGRHDTPDERLGATFVRAVDEAIERYPKVGEWLAAARGRRVPGALRGDCSGGLGRDGPYPTSEDG